MGSDWPIIKLSEVTSKITKGTTPSKKDGGFVSSGVNFIKAECVTLQGTVDESKFAYITDEVHEKYKRSHLAADDILFSMAGVILGKTALVKEEHLPANTNQALALIRPISEKILPPYLHYFLQQGSVFHFVNNSTSQSAQPNINLQQIGNLDITLPPLPEQKAIAHILGSLDDKIELNRRMNATLEGMAQALFKSWFTDFDPVIDNILIRNMGRNQPSPPPLPGREELLKPSLPSLPTGEKPSFDVEQSLALWERLGEGAIFAAAESPRPLGEDLGEGAIFDGIPEEFRKRAETRLKALADGTANREAAKNFPDSFIETEEMGWIPEGWEVQPLYDMASFINGAAYKDNDFSESPDALPVIKIAEIKGGITAQTNYTEVNKGDKYKIEDGEILLSWSGNPDTSIDTFIWSNGTGYLNQHIFKVTLHDESDRYFVYYQLKLLRSVFAEIARDKQTTGLGHFTAGDMKRLRVFRPKNELLTLFNNAVSSLYKRNYENSIATKMLSKLRDNILPKLISGELEV
jgi:type I restriction enzyme S subunit